MDRECAQICANWQFKPGVIAVAQVPMGGNRPFPDRTQVNGFFKEGPANN